MKIFRVVEDEIEYGYYDVSKRDFYYLEGQAIFQKENSKMFVLDLKNCKSLNDFEIIVNEFFLCDEVKVCAKNI